MGACMGEEDVAAYNDRLNAAFEARRIIAWPFDGPIKIEEYSKNKKLHEVFMIDNWCLISSYEGEQRAVQPISMAQRCKNIKSSAHRFDYDSYKIIYSHVMDEKFGKTIFHK